jgi:hypothetical protein
MVHAAARWPEDHLRRVAARGMDRNHGTPIRVARNGGRRRYPAPKTNKNVIHEPYGSRGVGTPKGISFHDHPETDLCHVAYYRHCGLLELQWQWFKTIDEYDRRAVRGQSYLQRWYPASLPMTFTAAMPRPLTGEMTRGGHAS